MRIDNYASFLYPKNVKGCNNILNQAAWITIQCAVVAMSAGIVLVYRERRKIANSKKSYSFKAGLKDLLDTQAFGPKAVWVPVHERNAAQLLTSIDEQQQLHETKPTIVLVHGFGCTSLEFSSLRRMLGEKELRVFSYDRVIAVKEELEGMQRLPLPRTVERLAQELQTLICKLKIRNSIIVGHSYGGLVAQCYAMMYPETVAGLVLLDPAHENQYSHFPYDFRLSFRAIPTLLWCYQEMCYIFPSFVKRLFETMDQFDLFNFPPIFLMKDKYLRKMTLQLYCDGDAWRRAREELEGCNESFQRMSNFRALHSDIPKDLPISLVLANDRRFSPTMFPNKITQAFIDIHEEFCLNHNIETFIAGDSDHWIHMQQPEIVIEAILSVLNRLDGQNKVYNNW